MSAATAFAPSFSTPEVASVSKPRKARVTKSTNQPVPEKVRVTGYVTPKEHLALATQAAWEGLSLSDLLSEMINARCTCVRHMTQLRRLIVGGQESSADQATQMVSEV